MPDAAIAASAPGETNRPNRITELKVSGHLMTLETGLFCVFQAPSKSPEDPSGLPGVRITPPPNAATHEGAVTISTFRQDGWIGARDDAALVRIAGGPAQILVTIYQAPGQPPEAAPRLQVLRLSPEGVGPAEPASQTSGAPGAPARPAEADVVAHIQRQGDVGGKFGDWIGTRGSRLWVEGFGLSPGPDMSPADIEYQAVLGRGWLSPWVECGKFCGSRGMALPLLGLRLRLKGAAADAYDCSYSASFVDGTNIGPVPAGEACQADSLAAMEAFQIVLQARPASAAEAGAPAARPPAAKIVKPVTPIRKPTIVKRR